MAYKEVSRVGIGITEVIRTSSLVTTHMSGSPGDKVSFDAFCPHFSPEFSQLFEPRICGGMGGVAIHLMPQLGDCKKVIVTCRGKRQLQPGGSLLGRPASAIILHNVANHGEHVSLGKARGFLAASDRELRARESSVCLDLFPWIIPRLYTSQDVQQLSSIQSLQKPGKGAKN